MRVAVLYPWSGLPATDRGAARRVVPLARFLASHGHEVVILSPGKGAPVEAGSVRFCFHEPSRLESVLAQFCFWIFDGATYRATGRSVSAHERRQLWHYILPLLQPSLCKAIRELSADVFLLEYAFWGRLVPRGRKVILTLHDILSDLVSVSWMQDMIFRQELKACARADAVVCVSERDRARLEDAGVKAEFIPHGFEISRDEHAFVSDGVFRQIEGHRMKGGVVVLFVGSSLQPNREAVERIREWAGSMTSDAKILFVVAGACSGEGKLGENILSLGVVSDEVLNQAYALSEIVLAPVTTGSGSSTKVLEALGRGKALVATTVGVRGWPVISGENAIVCDGLSEYPGIIRRLAEHPEERSKLEKSAIEFAGRYKHSAVYEPYLRIIES